MEFNKEYFINKFKKIPSDQWCRGILNDNNQRYCALGHLGIEKYSQINDNKRAQALCKIINGDKKIDENLDGRFGYLNVSRINDLKENNPKTNIINFLINIK